MGGRGRGGRVSGWKRERREGEWVEEGEEGGGWKTSWRERGRVSRWKTSRMERRRSGWKTSREGE